MSSPPSPPPPPFPRVPGPALAPFTPTAYADVDFLKSLGHSNDQDSYVWKVKTHNKIYALKMFSFVQWEYLKGAPGRYLTRPLANPQFYIDYFDPFNCECRVYGRLKQECREDLAVRAHGYLLLSPQQEAEVTRRVTGQHCDQFSKPDAELDGRNIWGRYEQHRGKPIRAIIKDFASGICFAPEQIAQMWDDLEALHALGILVRDIHVDYAAFAATFSTGRPKRYGEDD
ncbi:hypothetical protein VTI74DRAFT_8205 [Chaetomium olivicolor]